MYQDFSFEKYNGQSKVLNDAQSFVQAVQIILLSKPGNFPYKPDLGMNIGQYLFEYLDDDTIRDIKTELNYQIAKYLPGVGSLSIKIDRITDADGHDGLGIIIQSYINDNSVTVSMALLQWEHTIHIVHELY